MCFVATGSPIVLIWPFIYFIVWPLVLATISLVVISGIVLTIVITARGINKMCNPNKWALYSACVISALIPPLSAGISLWSLPSDISLVWTAFLVLLASVIFNASAILVTLHLLVLRKTTPSRKELTKAVAIPLLISEVTTVIIPLAVLWGFYMASNYIWNYFVR